MTATRPRTCWRIPRNAWRWHIQEREIRAIVHRGTVATLEYQARRSDRLMAAFR
jgi:hypothetical protein